MTVFVTVTFIINVTMTVTVTLPLGLVLHFIVTVHERTGLFTQAEMKRLSN